MTRKEALESLLVKVEAGDAYLRSHYKPTLKESANIAWSAYNGSLDAAKALHEAVLPGYGYGVGGWGARVWLYSNVPHWDGSKRQDVEMVDLPARAWLIAILKELIAQEAE